MARRPKKMISEFLTNFIGTDYKTDNGIVNRAYSVVLPDCKVFLRYPDRSNSLEIEVIKFKDICLVKDIETWKNGGIKIEKNVFPYTFLNQMTFIKNNVQNSKQLDYDERYALIQLGNEKLFLFKARFENKFKKQIIEEMIDPYCKNTVSFPIMDEGINSINEAKEKYLSNGTFLFHHLIFIPVDEKEVPKISNFFSKSELELIDNPPVQPNSIVNMRIYFDAFAYIENFEYNNFSILRDKRKQLLEKMKTRRVPSFLRYDLGILKWNPGCETISGIRDNCIYMKGPWEIVNSKNTTFTETLTEKWHAVYKIGT